MHVCVHFIIHSFNKMHETYSTASRCVVLEERPWVSKIKQVDHYGNLQSRLCDILCVKMSFWPEGRTRGELMKCPKQKVVILVKVDSWAYKAHD